MALTSSFGFTNTTSSSYDLTPTDIDFDQDYALITDDPGSVILKNVTGPQDQIETIQFLGQELNVVNQLEKNMHPSKVQNGRAFTVKVEAKKRTTSSTDDTFIEDSPVSCNITFRFTKSSQVDATDLLTLLQRAVGSLQDGSGWRLNNLMRMQLNPRN